MVVTRFHFFVVVIRSRIQTGRASQSAHFQVYSFIPQILHSHPLLGLGLNNFSLYYQAVTGQDELGPALLLRLADRRDGARRDGAVRASSCFWVFVRLRRGARARHALARAGDPLAARVRPLAWGWTAALAGTMAANIFYLTMQFYYFYVFLALALAVPLVFGEALATSPAKTAAPARARRPRGALPQPAAA